MSDELVANAGDADLLVAARSADLGQAASSSSGPAAIALTAPPPAPLDLEAEARKVIWINVVVDYGPLAGAFLPKACAERLDADRLQRIGAALAHLAEKKGWPAPAFADSPYAGLVRECFPVAEPVVIPFVQKLWSGEAAAPASSSLPAEKHVDLVDQAARPAAPASMATVVKLEPARAAPNGMTDDEFTPPPPVDREASGDTQFSGFNKD